MCLPNWRTILIHHSGLGSGVSRMVKAHLSGWCLPNCCSVHALIHHSWLGSRVPRMAKARLSVYVAQCDRGCCNHQYRRPPSPLNSRHGKPLHGTNVDEQSPRMPQISSSRPTLAPPLTRYRDRRPNREHRRPRLLDRHYRFGITARISTFGSAGKPTLLFLRAAVWLF